VPLNAKLKGVAQQIRIDGARDELQTLSIWLSDGDRSVMTLGSPMPP
jgi:hypothetical protein